MKLSGLVQRLPAADSKDVAAMPKLPTKGSMAASEAPAIQDANGNQPDTPSTPLGLVSEKTREQIASSRDSAAFTVAGISFDQEDVEALGSRGVLKMIPLHAIRLRPEFQTRMKLDLDHVEFLAESFRSAGQREPITLRVHEDHFELLGGHHRFEAGRRTGWNEIKAIVYRVEDQRAKFIAAFQNAGRMPESDYEKAKAWQKALDTGLAKTQQEVAIYAGVSPTEVSLCMSMLKLPLDVRLILDNNPTALSYNYARVVLDLCKKDEAHLDVIVEAVRKVADGLPQSSLKGWVASAISRKTGTPDAMHSSPKTFSSKSGNPVADLSISKGHFSIRNRGVISDEDMEKAFVAAIKQAIAQHEQSEE